MPASTSRVRLRPADSFDLIRLIARSQTDPRKAVAELVQNALDAQAAHVRVTWFSQRGRRALAVWDDGQGVFPGLQRPEALRFLATNIGASQKARLSAAERHRQMTLGKYGIGLLGFWSVGRRMEIRSRVAGSDPWVLALEEERRDAQVSRARTGRLPLDATFTEVVVTEIHAASLPQLKPRRLGAYLAGELRGQLLERDVRLEIHDRVSRGRAPKRLLVRPQRYQGQPVPTLAELAVEGHAAARVEIYLVPETQDRPGRVTLACGGATVLDDLAAIEGVERLREPWSLGRFEGTLDFPDLAVAPGSRRGFVPDRAAHALLAALPALEAELQAILAREASRRAQEREASDARDLRRLFGRLPRLLPEYALFDVRGRGGHAREAETTPAGEAVTTPEATPAGLEPVAEGPEPPPLAPATAYLYPPGPLDAVEVRPHRSVLVVEGTRRLSAHARDADGRALDRDLAFAWRLDGPGRIEGAGPTATYHAPAEPGEAVVAVEACEGSLRATGQAAIRVVDVAELAPRGGSGVPDPEPVDAPGEAWRSRAAGGRWQYNRGHTDYLAVRDHARRRLRYLVRLFAKEVVLRNFGDPASGPLLERMVEVLTHVDGAGDGRGERGA